MALGRKNPEDGAEERVGSQPKMGTPQELQDALQNVISELDRFKSKAMQLLNGQFDSKAELKRMTLMVKRATKDLEDQIFFLRKAL